MIAYFLDRSWKMIESASTTLPRGFRIIDKSESTKNVKSGTEVLELSLTYSKGKGNYKRANKMATPGNYIIYQLGSEYKCFTIIESEEDDTEHIFEIYAEDAGMDLLNEVCTDYTAVQSHSIAEYVRLFTVDSGFEIGVCEIPSTEQLVLNFQGEQTTTERLLEIAKEFDAELSYSFDIERMKLRHKYINIHRKRGKNVGVELRKGRDIKSITTKRSIANLATCLIVKGGAIEQSVGYDAGTSSDGTLLYNWIKFVESDYDKDTWAKVSHEIDEHGTVGEEIDVSMSDQISDDWYKPYEFTDNQQKRTAYKNIWIGVALKQTNPKKSDDWHDYTWARIAVGTTSAQTYPSTGFQVGNGYVWVKFSNEYSGAGMSDNPQGRIYIGLAINRSSATKSSSAGDYSFYPFSSETHADVGLEGYQYDDGDVYVSGSAIFSRSALQKWSRYRSEPGSDVGNIVRVFNSDATNPDILFKQAYTALIAHSDMDVAYEIELIGKPNIDVGDYVNIIGRERELYVKSRIYELKYDLVRDIYVAVTVSENASMIAGVNGDTSGYALGGALGVAGGEIEVYESVTALPTNLQAGKCVHVGCYRHHGDVEGGITYLVTGSQTTKADIQIGSLWLTPLNNLDNVVTWGADNWGNLNSDDAIANCIDFCLRGTIHFSRGKYKITRPIETYADTHSFVDFDGNMAEIFYDYNTERGRGECLFKIGTKQNANSWELGNLYEHTTVGSSYEEIKTYNGIREYHAQVNRARFTDVIDYVDGMSITVESGFQFWCVLLDASGKYIGRYTDWLTSTTLTSASFSADSGAGEYSSAKYVGFGLRRTDNSNLTISDAMMNYIIVNNGHTTTGHVEFRHSYMKNFKLNADHCNWIMKIPYGNINITDCKMYSDQNGIQIGKAFHAKPDMNTYTSGMTVRAGEFYHYQAWVGIALRSGRCTGNFTDLFRGSNPWFKTYDIGSGDVRIENCNISGFDNHVNDTHGIEMNMHDNEFFNCRINGFAHTFHLNGGGAWIRGVHDLKYWYGDSASTHNADTPNYVQGDTSKEYDGFPNHSNTMFAYIGEDSVDNVIDDCYSDGNKFMIVAYEDWHNTDPCKFKLVNSHYFQYQPYVAHCAIYIQSVATNFSLINNTFIFSGYDKNSSQSYTVPYRTNPDDVNNEKKRETNYCIYFEGQAPYIDSSEKMHQLEFLDNRHVIIQGNQVCYPENLRSCDPIFCDYKMSYWQNQCQKNTWYLIGFLPVTGDIPSRVSIDISGNVVDATLCAYHDDTDTSTEPVGAVVIDSRGKFTDVKFGYGRPYKYPDVTYYPIFIKYTGSDTDMYASMSLRVKPIDLGLHAPNAAPVYDSETDWYGFVTGYLFKTISAAVMRNASVTEVTAVGTKIINGASGGGASYVTTTNGTDSAPEEIWGQKLFYTAPRHGSTSIWSEWTGDSTAPAYNQFTSVNNQMLHDYKYAITTCNYPENGEHYGETGLCVTWTGGNYWEWVSAIPSGSGDKLGIYNGSDSSLSNVDSFYSASNIIWCKVSSSVTGYDGMVVSIPYGNSTNYVRQIFIDDDGTHMLSRYKSGSGWSDWEGEWGSDHSLGKVCGLEFKYRVNTSAKIVEITIVGKTTSTSISSSGTFWSGEIPEEYLPAGNILQMLGTVESGNEYLRWGIYPETSHSPFLIQSRSSTSAGEYIALKWVYGYG